MDYPELLKGYKNELIKLQEILLKERTNRETDEENAIDLLTKVKENYEQRYINLKENYENKIDDLENEIKELRREQLMLEEELKEEKVNKQLDDIKENQKLNRTLTSQSKTDLNKLKEELNLLKEENSQKQNHDKELNKQIESKLEEIEELKRKLDQLDISLNHKNNEISNLKLDLRLATRESTRNKEQLEFLRDSNRKLKEKIATLESNPKQTEYEDKESELNNMKRMLEETKRKNDILFSRISKFDDEKQNLNDEINNLKQQIKEQADKIAKQHATNLKLKQVIDTTNKQDDELQSYCDELLIENDKLSKNNEKHLKEIESLNIQLDQYKNKLSNLQEQLNRLNNELNGKESCIEKENFNLNKRIKELEERLDNEISNNTNYLKDIKELQQECFNKECELSRVESGMNEQIGLMNQLKEERSRYLTESEELKQKNYSLAKMYDDLMKKYTLSKNRISALLEENDLKDSNYNIEKLRFQETINQQSKLIDHLAQFEKDKTIPKKSWFASIVSPSDNSKSPALSTPFAATNSAKKISQVKELESALEREVYKNKILMQKITELERNQKKRKIEVIDEIKIKRKPSAPSITPSSTDAETSSIRSSEMDKHSLLRRCTSPKNLDQEEEEFTFTESIMEELAYKDD